MEPDDTLALALSVPGKPACDSGHNECIAERREPHEEGRASPFEAPGNSPPQNMSDVGRAPGASTAVGGGRRFLSEPHLRYQCPVAGKAPEDELGVNPPHLGQRPF